LGNIVLSKKEYNKLHGKEVKGCFNSEDATNYYCEDINGEIRIIERIYDIDKDGAEYIESEDIVARFNANTPDGEIFSGLANLALEMRKNTITRLAENPIQSEYRKISKINEAVKQLQSQLIKVFREWEYKQ